MMGANAPKQFLFYSDVRVKYRISAHSNRAALNAVYVFTCRLFFYVPLRMPDQMLSFSESYCKLPV